MDISENRSTYDHPDYERLLPDWTLMRDAYAGERAVKAKSTAYLPATRSHVLDGFYPGGRGMAAYESYRTRARFYNFVREAVQSAVGVMHARAPHVKLPPEMEGVLGVHGRTIPEILRAVNEAQFLCGRVGLHLDIGRNGIPYVAIYQAESIRNWDDGPSDQQSPQELRLVVLDESERSLDYSTMKWGPSEDKWRVLRVANPDDGGPAEYTSTVVRGDLVSGAAETFTPSIQGRRPPRMPFVMINACDLAVAPDDPPLLDLANLCMTVYRGDADYRYNLYLQGQDTLVIIGGALDDDEDVRTGAGSRLTLASGGDAKYVGVNSAGLEEQRMALENDKGMAGSLGAQTLDSTSRERESGDSLRVRVASRTADLRQIAMTGALGLQDILRTAAEWMGLDPTLVEVRPNLEFAEQTITTQGMVEATSATNQGAPISRKTWHEHFVRQGITSMTWEEELAQIKSEKDSGLFQNATGDVNPANGSGAA